MVKQIERCRAFIPIPDEDEGLIRCGAVAEEQCENCTDWFCCDESEPHLLVCVTCGRKFCGECLPPHRLVKECALEINEMDVTA